MKNVHISFRILLACIALGLAAVSLQKFMLMVPSESPVDLPNDTLSDVTFALPTNRSFNGEDVGTGHEQTGLSIEIVDRTRLDLLFRVENAMAISAFLPYDLDDEKDRLGSIPYWLECKTKGGDAFKPVLQYDYAPSLKPLRVGEYFTFPVPKSEVKGTCKLSLSYYTDERALWLVQNRLFDMTNAERGFLDQNRRSVQYSFK